jgi:hypothetical protein
MDLPQAQHYHRLLRPKIITPLVGKTFYPAVICGISLLCAILDLTVQTLDFFLQRNSRLCVHLNSPPTLHPASDLAGIIGKVTQAFHFGALQTFTPI